MAVHGIAQCGLTEMREVFGARESRELTPIELSWSDINEDLRAGLRLLRENCC